MQDKAKTKAQLMVELDDARQRVAELEARQAEHQRAQQVQNALFRIADATSAAEDIQDFYAAMHRIVDELMYARNFYIALWDEAAQVVNIPYVFDEFDAPTGTEDLQIPMDQVRRGMTGYVIRTEKPLHASADREAELEQQGELESVGAQQVDWLGVPLKTDEGIIGVLVVQSYTEGVTYTDQDLTLLNYVGQHIATALERARLIEETRRLLAETEARNAELAIINSVQQGLAAKLDIQAIYDLVGDQIRDVFDAQGVAISHYERSTNQVQWPYYLFQGEQVNLPAVELGPGLNSHIIETGQPLLINEHAVERFKEFGAIFAPGESEDTAKSWLGVPLVTGGHVTGVIQLENYERERAYSDSDVRLLTTLANSMSIALENARLFDETQRLLKETEERNAELTVINSVQRALAIELDMQIIYDLVGDQIRDLFDAQTVAIVTFDHDAELEHFRYLIEKGKRYYPEPRPLEGVRRHLIRTRQLVLINENYEQAAAKYGMRVVPGTQAPKSLVFVPLVVGESVKGYVSLQNVDREGAFSESDVRLLSTLAGTMSMALENARLFDKTNRLLEETEQRAAELAIINSVGQALAQQLDFQAIIDLVGDKIQEVTRAPVVNIALYDRGTDQMQYRYSNDAGRRGEHPEEPRPLDPFRRQVVASRQPLVINEGFAQRAADYGVPAATYGDAPKSLLFVPITLGEEVAGIISLQHLEREHAFDDSDLRLLTTITANAGVALENARLFEAEREQALRQAALFRLSADIAAALDEDDICRALVDGLQDEALGYPYLAVLLLDYKTGDRVERASIGKAEPGSGRLRLRPGQGLSERTLQDGKLHYTPDVTQAEQYVPALASGAEVDVPIKVGGEVVGVLVVESSEPNAFNQRDFDVLTSAANQAGVALGRARSLMETRQRAAELATVNSIGQAIGSQLDLDALIQLVGEQVRQSFAADIAYVAMHDRQTNMIHFAYEYGDRTPSRPFGKGLTERIIESRRSLLINQDIEHRQAELETERIGIQALSYLGVPIVIGQEAIGVVSVQSVSQEGRFDESDRNLLSTIAANVGAAIHNARLYQETQRRAEEMAVLAEIGRDVSATLDLPTVLERIASHARDLLSADSSAVYLAEPGGQTMQAIVALGDIADEIKASPIQLGQGIIGDLAKRKAAEVINEVNNDPRAVHIPGTPQISDERIMAAPLLSGDQANGMMAVWRTGSGKMFTQADLRFLEGLARHGAIAIGNAHLYEQAQEAQAAAEEASKAKSTFLANMSHELRTPLNAIIGFTRIVKRRGTDILPDKQLENLNKVLASAEHLLELINSILDIAKIEAGRVEVKPTTFDAGALVDMCITTTQPMVVPDQVTLVKDVSPDLPPIYSDQDKVKQILLNLLSNAAKFTQAGQITVSARNQDEKLVVDVTDTGIGILEKDLERIFDEFQQADSSFTREYGGTGLGLSISRHLAHLLGGEVHATSSAGVGSTFTLTIPLRYGDEEASPPVQPEPEQVTPISPSRKLGDKVLILAIDDDPDVIYLLQENLGEAGYQVVGALGGAEGVQKARELRPFAITLDIMMPHKDGWQVLHELKTDVATRDIPIIVLSIVDKKELGYRLGADDYLVKPLDSEAVLAALNRLPQTNGGLPPRRLLVVDDDPHVIDMIRQLLDETAYLVEGAEDGVAALEVISQERPDVILLDLMMPRLDGLGVIEQLKQDPRHKRIPIVVLTARTPSNEEIAHLQHHVSQVMHKQGLDGDILIEELQRALSGLASPSPDEHNASGG